MAKLFCVAVALVACGKSGDKASGGGSAPPKVETTDEHSREGVIRAATAALAAGDLEKLVALADPMATFAFDCSKAPPATPADAPFRDPKLMLTKMRKDFAREIEALKGTKLEVSEISAVNHDVSASMEAGSQVAGCVVKTPYRVVVASFKIKVGEPAWEDEIGVSMYEIAGRYYLTAPPIIRTKKVLVALAEIARDRMCECHDKPCADDVDDRHGSFVDLIKGAHEPMTDDDTKQAAAIDDAFARCKKQATGALTWEEAAAKQSGLVDQICACEDKACAGQVTAEMAKLSRDLLASLDPSKPPDPAMTKRFEELKKRQDGCTAKLTR
jgi:hypothetical protein